MYFVITALYLGSNVGRGGWVNNRGGIGNWCGKEQEVYDERFAQKEI